MIIGRISLYACAEGLTSTKVLLEQRKARDGDEGLPGTIAGETPTMPHMVFCARFKQEMEGLDEPPFDSDFGNKVYNNVSKKAWQEWVERQKMLLNEYRLQPWTPQAQEFLVEQMDQFFFGEGAALPKEYVPPTH
jgi:Fe-S cluster biosynthesis and repair protein YggX